MDSLIKDIRYAARGLLKHPGFTAIVILTLTLGISASTAIFSVLNTVMLQPLPYNGADSIAVIQELNLEGKRVQVTPANFLDWRAQNTVFENLSAIHTRNANLALADQADRLDVAMTSANFFSVFGVQPQHGRLFIPADEQAGHALVVVISHSLWQRRFAGDPGIVGKPITLDGQGYNVIGIAPVGFQYPDKTEAWLPPFKLAPALNERMDVTQVRGFGFLSTVARLKPGLSLQQASAEMETITARLRQQYPDTNNRRFNRVVSLHKHLVGDTGGMLVLLFGGTVYTRELTAMVRAVVNDDANVESYTMDLTQGTRQVKDGVAVYIETGTTMKEDGGNYTESNFRVIRHSQQATAGNAEPLSRAGLEAAFATGLTALKIAEQNWQSGGCTKIEARSPGNVSPSSTTPIPVTVRHRFDGSEVPSKLDAALKGEKSVDPTSLAKTRGTLSYVAPNEKNKSATIGLTATSRRGRATLDLNASTGGQSYRVAGVSNGVSFTGEICSLDKPFVLEAKFPGGSAKTSFAPSNGTGGATTVSGGGGGCVHSGGGTYTVTTNADGSGTITWTTTDKIACPWFSNSRTATFTLPLQPAPEISCP